MNDAPGEKSQNKTYRRVLTIAGSDSGGGAGIQADLKTIAALECYGLSAITALRAQNTHGVNGVHAVSPEFVGQQIQAVLEDIGADAVKIGMLFSSEIMEEVARLLAHFDMGNVVLDPVMVAQSGDRLLLDSAVATMKKRIIPLSRVITPNIHEAEVLISGSIRDEDEMFAAAVTLSELGCENVLIKGGKFAGVYSTDVLYLGKQKRTVVLREMFLDTRNSHGTGCTLSSAIAAFLAHGMDTEQAVKKARAYVQEAIASGSAYQIGHGNGPVHHFHAYWN